MDLVVLVNNALVYISSAWAINSGGTVGTGVLVGVSELDPRLLVAGDGCKIILKLYFNSISDLNLF